jgi:response regulator RpfG family c-di-GMP phosphodiesterase
MIRGSLDMAGHLVLEAETVDEAIHYLEVQTIHCVLASLDLPNRGASTLLNAIRDRPAWAAIPVMALAESSPATLPADFQECLDKFDHASVLASIARLASALAPDVTVAVPA